MALTPGAKKVRNLLAILLVVGGLAFTANKYGYFDKFFGGTAKIEVADLPPAMGSSVTPNLKFTGFPTENPTTKTLPGFKIANMAWNSQLGLHYANGGPITTEGSLMEKAGVKLEIIRQDMIPDAAQQLLSFAKSYKDNPNSRDGIQAFIMMGDGSPATLATIAPELEKLGPEFRPIIIGAVGLSAGEDQLMGPISWKQNPQNARGALIATTVLDGDWNTTIQWANDNNLPINLDDKTYFPGGLNFVNVDNIAAAQAYVNGFTEERVVVDSLGKAVKENGNIVKKKVTVNAVAVWTPSDITVASKKGGLVRIISTKEYASQMPGVIITIKKFADDNRQMIENFLSAALEGGDQVKSFSPALDKAGDISAKIYNGSGDEREGQYWVKASKGYILADPTGLQVEVGGSRQFNLGDNVNLFGLNGGTNIFEVVYKNFGDVVTKYYPKMYPSYPAPSQTFDLSFLQNVLSRNKDKVAPTTRTYASGSVAQVITDKSYQIEFGTGNANLTAAGKQQLEKVFSSGVVATDLKIDIEGHTDNTGSESVNQALSEARANAVKDYLQSKSMDTFPDSRLSTRGLGSTSPVADNNTEAGRSKNRRVTIKMGN